MSELHKPGGCRCEEVNRKNVCKRCGCRIIKVSIASAPELHPLKIIEDLLGRKKEKK